MSKDDVILLTFYQILLSRSQKQTYISFTYVKCNRFLLEFHQNKTHINLSHHSQTAKMFFASQLKKFSESMLVKNHKLNNVLIIITVTVENDKLTIMLDKHTQTYFFAVTEYRNKNIDLQS